MRTTKYTSACSSMLLPVHVFLLPCILTSLSIHHSTMAIAIRDANTSPSTPLHPEAADADRQALLCFKSQLSDPSGSLTSWSSNTSLQFCNWHGINCSKRQPSRVAALDLDNSQLTGVIPPCIANLTFLRVMHLQRNNLRGSIPPELGLLQRLRYLNLSTNALDGDIPTSLGGFPSLVYIDLGNNNLTGQIPGSIVNSSSLQLLRLGQNNLGGKIPSIISKSSSLVRIDLRHNNLIGHIPPSLGNVSSLSYLYLSENNLIGGVPESLGSIKNLIGLGLASNMLSGTVPPSLHNVSSLVFLDISGNLLTGALPYDIGNSLPNIETLNLLDNKFEGSVPASLANATSLKFLYLSSNSFSGAIPSLGSLHNLLDLDFAYNHLEAKDWAFLSSLSSCIQLTKLLLQSNNLEGSLPSSIGNLSNTVSVLWLSLNRISGTIPLEIRNLKNLTYLAMHDNMLSGSIPSVIGTLRYLSILSLSGNKLSGPIPDSFGSLERLTELYLRENELSGSIPRSLGNCKNLLMLNLSHNSLDGSIPSELLKIFSLSRGLDLSHNSLTGSIPQEVGTLVNLGLLSISYNQLSRQIPSTLGQCVVLETLHMEGNFLDGRIPKSLVSLRGIKHMDLSQNNLSGQIPEFFASFTSLHYLNLSFNDFSGAIPTTGVFTNASEVPVQGNKRLCTRVPMLGLPLCSKDYKGKHKSLTTKIVIPLIVVAMISLSSFGAILLKRRTQPPLDHSKEKVKVSYEDIVKATDRFSIANLIGSGSFGTVYKGTLMPSNINPVAIKVFNLNLRGASRSFLAECESLRNIRHRNLVKVITSCSSIDRAGVDFKAIIFQYMPNGSLEMWLHPKSHMHDQKRFLSLGQRISIAADVAFALDYLHNQCVIPLVHCDLKPLNVLLDYDMTACVSDLGLARFICTNYATATNSSTSLVGLKGSIGYVPPEYGMGAQISTKGDVYSYGVLLLEMFTGKRPTDETFKDDLRLHNFVNSAFPDKIGEILDPIILQESRENENQAIPTMHSCIIPLIKLGLLCSVESPKNRPTMGHVSTEVDAIKSSFSIQMFGGMKRERALCIK